MRRRSPYACAIAVAQMQHPCCGAALRRAGAIAAGACDCVVRSLADANKYLALRLPLQIDWQQAARFASSYRATGKTRRA